MLLPLPLLTVHLFAPVTDATIRWTITGWTIRVILCSGRETRQSRIDETVVIPDSLFNRLAVLRGHFFQSLADGIHQLVIVALASHCPLLLSPGARSGAIRISTSVCSIGQARRNQRPHHRSACSQTPPRSLPPHH